MFRERKNTFVCAMKLIRDSIMFSGFTVLAFCFVLLPIFWQKIVCSLRSSHAGSHNTTAEKVPKDFVRRNLMQYSFGEITGFVCVCLVLTYMPQLTFGVVWFRWCVIAVWQAVYHTSKSVHHSRVKYTRVLLRYCSWRTKITTLTFNWNVMLGYLQIYIRIYS